MVNKNVIVNILMNLLKFEESWKELTRGTAELERTSWSNIFGTSTATKCVKKCLFSRANCFGEFTILS